MERFLAIKGIEGKMLLDHRTAGNGHKHFVGHARATVGTRPDPLDASKTLPKVAWTFDPDHEPLLVPDPYPGGYYRLAILNGDVEYVASIEIDDKGVEVSNTIDRDLMEQTIRARVRRQHAELVQAEADAKLDDAEPGAYLAKVEADAKKQLADAHAAKLEALSPTTKAPVAPVKE